MMTAKAAQKAPTANAAVTMGFIASPSRKAASFRNLSERARGFADLRTSPAGAFITSPWPL
jgi:hypothetical protein